MACREFGMFVFATLLSLSSARAVNISNTWMLPEEGFPVFYRYFRDRISWYEADAVCQFHHANLVTADSTSQYDAIRAYLKELDITENIWIGLSKASEKPNFTWTNSQPLSGEGHWQEAIPKTNNPMCVTMDPTADFLWKAMSCGGPEIASFICELPVPSWALGPRGCLLTELPSLTVLYIPEQSAVELTSDCGLDGTKRIACKGNADREEILRQLTCAISQDDFDDKSTRSPIASSTIYETSSDENSLNSKTTKTWIWTSNTVDIDYGMPTRHRRETDDTLSPVSTKSTVGLSTTKRSYRKKMTTSESFTTSATNYDTEVTTNSLEGDTTLDPSMSETADKSLGINETKQGLTTPRSHPEVQGEMVSEASAATTDHKITVTDTDETAAEYPSAINQGQLFSIIEDGTMFDIIELNDSNSDLERKQHALTTTDNGPKVTTTQSSETLKHITNDTKPAFKSEQVTKKGTYKDVGITKSSKALSKNVTKIDEKHKDLLSREVELYPIIKDTSIKLNRTFRKQLPLIYNENDKLHNTNKFGLTKVINLSIKNDLSNSENEDIEIELKGEKNNITEMLFITTTKAKHFEDINEKEAIMSPQNRLLNNDPEIVTEETNNIHSKQLCLHFFKNCSNMQDNIKSAATNSDTNNISEMKVEPQSLLDSVEPTDHSTNYMESGVTQNELETEPEQPRPNRQRQLTRPQRRSFYPYFFSRVLG